MLAFLLLATATSLGMVVARGTDVALGPFSRLGLGIALGQLLLLWVPFGCAAALDLGAFAAGLLALGLMLLSLGLAAWRSEARGMARFGLEPRALLDALRDRTKRPLIAVGSVFLCLLSWLHHTHYLLPRDDGLHSAGVTWGDLPMHLGLATRFLYADGFGPLEHPMLAGERLGYPFLPDYAVAVLSGLGLPLRWAFIVGGLVPLSALLLLFVGLVELWTGARRSLVPALSLCLFLLSGGLGFYFFAERWLAGEPLSSLLAAVNATFDISPHVLKSGHIGNLLIAARSAAYGMPIALAALLLLGHLLASGEAKRVPLVLAGLLVGGLPLVHSHSFLVLGGVVACYAAIAWRFRARWLYCLTPLALAALPQVLFLLGANRKSFLRLAPGFLRKAPSASDWLLDVALGVGAPLLLLPLALLIARPLARRLAAPLLLLLPLSNLLVFTPVAYDNVKLLAFFDLGAAPLLAVLIARLLAPDAGARGRGARRALGIVALTSCTLSGALAVGHELTNDARVISTKDLRLVELVKQHTAPSTIVATSARYHDPVAMLSGRRPLIAAPYMLTTHGIDVRARAGALLTLYAGGRRARQVIARHHVGAVVLGPHERRVLPKIDEAFLEREAQAVYEVDKRKLYVLSP